MFRSKQQGSALMVSIFVITVMAVMAMGLMKINWSQSDTTTREVLGTRAWFAAHSGIEWGLNRLFPIDDGSTVSLCAASADFPVATENFHNCRASVICEAFTVPTSAGNVTHYKLESTGTCGTGKHQMVRVQEAWAKELK
ncbi:MSHA biogenesis protein MshP [Photobacterium sagamiensis]|uniref:MSHA biogenesis protein MshP n=1 Tax=Photobacterium sagamiensis TaxID=2910241 RepID=UPI003D152781